MTFDIRGMDLELFMREALKEAEIAGKAGELPIGAVIVHRGHVISRGHALHETRRSKIAHAELSALLQAEQYLLNWASDDCVLFTTMEPCVMCLGAIVMSNIRHIVFSLEDKWIKPGGMLDIDYVGRHVHNYIGGVLAEESLALYKKYKPSELPLILEGKHPKMIQDNKD
ncbi:MAG: nucleoside deaminase [Dehalococcoidales bacterium]|nr:nucleoside deaminase [Dehalococcoidales bacterium]